MWELLGGPLAVDLPGIPGQGDAEKRVGSLQLEGVLDILRGILQQIAFSPRERPSMGASVSLSR